MTNICKKGKRVELEVANWLKFMGATSARRTQQHNGLGGLSDVCAEELPNWHIEVKGTVSPLIPRAKIQAWYTQVIRDCPPSMWPVIIHKANNKDLIAILTQKSWEALSSGLWEFLVTSGDSVNPSQILYKKELENKIEGILIKDHPPRIAPNSLLVYGLEIKAVKKRKKKTEIQEEVELPAPGKDIIENIVPLIMMRAEIWFEESLLIKEEKTVAPEAGS